MVSTMDRLSMDSGSLLTDSFCESAPVRNGVNIHKMYSTMVSVLDNLSIKKLLFQECALPWCQHLTIWACTHNCSERVPTSVLVLYNLVRVETFLFHGCAPLWCQTCDNLSMQTSLFLRACSTLVSTLEISSTLLITLDRDDKEMICSPSWV